MGQIRPRWRVCELDRQPSRAPGPTPEYEEKEMAESVETAVAYSLALRPLRSDEPNTCPSTWLSAVT